MDVGAWETENALKEELDEVNDQVTTIKERTAEVRHGKCFVLHHEVARRVATGRRAHF
jgi:hypothetical protein